MYRQTLGTLKKVNEADGSRFKINNDTRQVVIGKLLVKTGLDVLPTKIQTQLFYIELLFPSLSLPGENQNSLLLFLYFYWKTSCYIVNCYLVILHYMQKGIKHTKNNDTFILIMPAFNEEENIEKTINEWSSVIQKFKGSEILVINDGSTDKTKKIIKKLVVKYRFLKVLHKINEGHGKTILRGYKYAIESNHQWVFQTDSDNQFTPNDFSKLWKRRHGSNFVLGYRYNRKDPFYRKLLTLTISTWILILFGKYIKDSNIPFRLIKRTYLKNLLKMIPDGVFAPNIFLSVLAARDGQNLQHIPVNHETNINEGFFKTKLIVGTAKGFFELLIFRFSNMR